MRLNPTESNMFDILTGPLYGHYGTNYDYKKQTVCRIGLLNLVLIVKDWRSVSTLM